MPNEISFTGSLSVYKPSIMTNPSGRSAPGLSFNMAGLYTVEGNLQILLTATLIPMGQVSAPHWSYFRNLDPTNFVTLFNGVTGAALPRLLALEPCFVPLDPTGVYYALADTAPCALEYFIASL
jgi:hypothetical protein